MKKNILIGVFVSLALSAAIVGGILWYGSKAPVKGGGFALNYRGQEWDFFQHAKKLNLVYVGYVKCPDVCPMTLSFASQAFRQLSPAELENVQLFFISVDADHDTPQGVADYAAQFYPAFMGLMGPRAAIDAAVNNVGASYMVEKEPGSYLGYSISHSDRIFLLNKNGEVRDTVPNLRSAKALVDKIKEYL